MKKSFPAHLVLFFVLTLLVIGLIVSGGLWWLRKHQETQTNLSDLETRYARMLGLKLSQSEMELGDAHAKELVGQLVYSQSQDTSQVGNDAQQRVRSLFVGAGLEVASIQILPPKPDKHFDRIPVAVRFEGQLTSLQSAMVVLASQKPTIFVEGFSMQTIGLVKPDTPQRLTGQFNMYVLRPRV